MYIHTFVKNKLDVYIKIKILIIWYKVILSQIISWRVQKAIDYLTNSDGDYREYPVCSLVFLFLIVFAICFFSIRFPSLTFRSMSTSVVLPRTTSSRRAILCQKFVRLSNFKPNIMSCKETESTTIMFIIIILLYQNILLHSSLYLPITCTPWTGIFNYLNAVPVINIIHENLR